MEGSEKAGPQTWSSSTIFSAFGRARPMVERKLGLSRAGHVGMLCPQAVRQDFSTFRRLENRIASLS